MRGETQVQGRRGAACLVFGLLVLLTFSARAHAASASWSFEPSSWDFGIRIPEAGPSPPEAFTLTNTGEVELHPVFVSLGSEPGAGFNLAGNDCGALAPNASCQIEVTFDPTAPGPWTAELAVDEQHSLVAPATAELSGIGAGPAVAITPSSLVFDSIGVGKGPSPSKTITVANEGQLDLNISSLSIESDQVINVSGADQEPFKIAGGSCVQGLVVPPKTTCTVEVTFSPSVQGTLTADLRVADNAPGSPHLAALEGLGMATVEPLGPFPVGELRLLRNPIIVNNYGEGFAHIGACMSCEGRLTLTAKKTRRGKGRRGTGRSVKVANSRFKAEGQSIRFLVKRAGLNLLKADRGQLSASLTVVVPNPGPARTLRQDVKLISKPRIGDRLAAP